MLCERRDEVPGFDVMHDARFWLRVCAADYGPLIHDTRTTRMLAAAGIGSITDRWYA